MTKPFGDGCGCSCGSGSSSSMSKSSCASAKRVKKSLSQPGQRESTDTITMDDDNWEEDF